MKTNFDSPQELLAAIAAQCMGDAAIEAKPVTTQSWRGFTFQVGDLNIVFPFKGGFEILPGRDIQAIPWVKDWLYGITNVRGEVYTVVDLAKYLGFEGVRSLRTTTFFLLPDAGLRSTLLIDSRVSLRSFSEFLEHGDSAIIPEILKPCVSAVLVDGGQAWIVVDVDALCRSPEFVNAGEAAVASPLGTAA